MRGRAFVLLFSFGNGAEMLSADRDEGQGFYFFLCFSGIDSGKLSADRDGKPDFYASFLLPQKC